MNQNKILKGIPDKRQDTDTTSLKFKRDLIEFFEKDYQDKTCLEIGTNKGYTTRMLSFLFKNVITCENDWDLLKFAEDVNKDRDNIEFLHLLQTSTNPNRFHKL
jgi:protein-L-isoaspartate O-methyltransferase